MDKAQSVEEFYRTKLKTIPDNLRKELGHFNVFSLDEYVGKKAKPIPYSRKSYYKISLMIGPNRIHYADKIVEIEKQALLFANPHIPYNWEPLSEEQSGFFCIFTESFFEHFGSIKEYPVFRPGGEPIFEISDQQLADIEKIFIRMLDEIASQYVYKYDILRNLVFELIHSAQKMQAVTNALYSNSNAAMRVSSLFLELLERQFPIESPTQKIRYRSAIAFAEQLSIHVNHLNRSLKEVTGKTTSQLIAERVIQEARVLLKHTDWNVSEVAWCLGFEDLSNFINFFKKNSGITPATFRKGDI
ncbi:AraC family transcriptional regulator [Cesiribacter sp. SM1]|uniref:helix-turn-helix domain-containing protein n=1 Tax=Cesiribacter sp. SM1 TaxID=2861196 RepID=UPI001CD66267|nr:helix-turn-helix domain-containing protein [Cesiribacter sp. SM1]